MTYGQQAVLLPDGSAVLHEIGLTPEQIAGLEHDHALLAKAESARRGMRRTAVLVRAASILTLLATATLLVTGLLPELPALAITLVFLFSTDIMNHVARKLDARHATSIAQLKAMDLFDSVSKNYLAGEPLAQRLASYFILLSSKELPLTKKRDYRIQLHAVGGATVIRMVRKHDAAAAAA
jgi:hypothetical protein